MTKEQKLEKKIKIAYAQSIKDKMSTEEKIAFLNTPYNELPEELKPGMTKNPQMFNFVRVSKKNIGQQQETFAARLIRYRDKYRLKPEDFCEICNEFASQFDLPATKSRRAQRTRITLRDLKNYENFNICPKIDKMTIIAKAMGVDIDYFAGYGSQNRSPKNVLMLARYNAGKES